MAIQTPGGTVASLKFDSRTADSLLLSVSVINPLWAVPLTNPPVVTIFLPGPRGLGQDNWRILTPNDDDIPVDAVETTEAGQIYLEVLNLDSGKGTLYFRGNDLKLNAAVGMSVRAGAIKYPALP